MSNEYEEKESALKEKERFIAETEFYKSNVRILPFACAVVIAVSLFWLLMDLFFESYKLTALSKAGVILQLAVSIILELFPIGIKRVKTDVKRNNATRVAMHIFNLSLLTGIVCLTFSRNAEMAESGFDLSNIGISIIVFYVFIMIFMPFPRVFDSALLFCGIALSLLVPPLSFKGMTYQTMAGFVLVGCYFTCYIFYRRTIMDRVKKANQVSELSEKLMTSSITDPLTHAFNRLALDDYIQSLLDAGKSKTLGVIFFDIDYFKQYNDHYGHVAGDDVLKRITSAVQKEISGGVRYLYRFGGEEFVVLIADPSEEELISQMRGIRNAVFNEHIDRDDVAGFDCITITVGGSIEPLPNERGDYITNADNQLYMGKKSTRNCVYYKNINYDLETHKETLASVKEKSVNDFYRALKNGEFKVFVQPKHNVKTREITGGEALVRWESGDGVLSPGIFITALEESRQIVHLDMYMFEEVCRRLREALDRGLHPFPVSVNMSRVTLFMPETLNKYLEILHKYGIPFDLVPLELTESYSSDGANIREALTALRNAGFRIYFDDFGSGYSSLSNLYMLSFDTVKLDKSLIDGIGNEDSEELLRHIIELSHFLKHDVTAEGVESNEQFLFLKKLNCDSIQGYFFSKPVRYEEYETLAEEGYRKAAEAGTEAVQDTTGEIGSLRVTNDIKLNYLSALAGIYMTMHVINLPEDTVVEFSTTTNVKENCNKPTHAIEQMKAVMKSVTAPEYLDAMLEFTDLTTIADRMMGKRSITKEFKGIHFGLTRAQFVAVNIDGEGKPTVVIYTTQVISETRSQSGEEGVCITDQLTGVYNRLAMESDIDKIINREGGATSDNLSVLVSDVNGLRRTNIQYGRNAGDELIKGTAQCLKAVYGKCGKVFRMQDDIFVVLYYTDSENIKALEAELESAADNWIGDNVRTLSISFANASVWEFDSADPGELIRIAQKRMMNYKLKTYSE